MYADNEKRKEYQRKWHREYRKKHPGERKKYPHYRDSENIRPIRSVIKLNIFMKICTNCKKNKPYTSFYIKKNGHPASWCKACAKVKAKELREENPERYKSYQKLNWRKYVKKDVLRCDKCEIRIGPRFMETKTYKFRGKNLCEECYDERHYKN